MGKHSKKRRRDSGSSEDEFILRKKLKQVQKQLYRIEKHHQRSVSPNRLHSRSVSPSVSVSTRTDNISLCHAEFDTQSESGSRFDNEAAVGYEPLQGQEVDLPDPDTAASELDQTVLSILGYDLTPAKVLTPPFKKEVALSWTTILTKGLPDDERLLLINKNVPPENCPLLQAPKVNPEVISVTRDVVARRDTKICDLQNQIGAALSSLGQALSILVKDSNNNENLPVMKFVSDASRLLLDFHHKQSKSRRELISLDLKKEVRETLSNVPVDGWLFGDKLGDRLKASKEMERSGLELKAPKPKIFKKSAATTTQNLNFKRPPRPQGEIQGGRRQVVHNPRFSRPQNPHYQHQERKKPAKDVHRSRNPKDRTHY